MNSRADTDTQREATSAPPLYVDLDGTLISSDLLWESLCQLAHGRPASLLRIPGWLAGGRAAFKRRVAEQVQPDVSALPYRPEVLSYLEEQREAGRRIVLATASDASLAKAVADHLGLFDDAFGSDGSENAKGLSKLSAIRAREGEGPFEYLGDSRADLAVWRGSTAATLVAPAARTARAAGELGVPTRILLERPSRLRPALRSLRAYQWVKNALLFAPLVLAQELGDAVRLLDVTLAFIAFCCVASATYLVNDLLDIEADRQHPRKCKRPFAAGTLPIPLGAGIALGLLIAGFGLSAGFASPASTAMLACYLGLTTAYSFYFKEQLFLDVLILAGLYALRVLAGGVAADVPVSPWLLAFSLFFFLSLAFVKRYAELLGVQATQRERLERRGYEVGDLGLVETMGTTAGYLSVLVLALYVNGAAATGLYRDATLLWAVCPIMLYWITRIWFLARRGTMQDDPVLFAATDRVSYLAGGAIGVVGLLAALR
jgi:4-hydroxybenzoate polyprenyltransferase